GNAPGRRAVGRGHLISRYLEDYLSSFSASLVLFLIGVGTFSNVPPAFATAAFTLALAPCTRSVTFSFSSPRAMIFTVWNGVAIRPASNDVKLAAVLPPKALGWSR